ncbi:macrolide 2'-phosphotransferase [Paenibacillus agricola]|uniref:Phosphotransferase n=1 Tax=Paenibacillus agricola TaxID=2716264 RepID=A0ABX0J607_9BACL|nr:macrolide 2'-phosphotransferase [Paenibacillus agricola]NHN30267.1 phosphotransferase [Paenibacillus agricola]
MSSNNETTDYKTTVKHILSIAHVHGFDIDTTSVKVNESGLDFLAVFASTKDGLTWVLRTPRRADVVESAAYEKKVLDLLAGHLPVSVPNWQVHTPELIAYKILEGNPAATINPEAKNYEWYLNPESLPELFEQSLAEAMVALHSMDHGAAIAAGVRVLQPNEVRQALAEKMETVQRNFGVSQALWERWQRWLADDTFWPNHSSLVHGDLHPGHIVVDPVGKVTGLLDWTEAEVADPAIDFTMYYALFGASGLSSLIERYEQAGGLVWPRMHEHIIEMMAAYPMLIAMFAQKSGLEEYRVMARAALGVNEYGEELPAE